MSPGAGADRMIYAFEDCELDLKLFQLRRAGELVPLEPQVFDVLAYLVEHHDRMVPKQELLDHIWPERYITEAALNSRLMAARKAIGDNGRDQRLIRTAHGRGYHFVAPVRVVEDGAALPAPAVSEPAGGPALRTLTPAAPPAFDIPTTSFIGRAAELARLDELLARPACRLVTIVGPGGVGKTRLAFECAARQRAKRPEVALVPLESVGDPSHLPSAVAAALGVALAREDVAGAVCDYLASREAIIVLDNFEQLAEGGAEFLTAIIHAAPGVRLLVTSRVVLGLREEWVFSIGGLSLSESDGGPSEAVRLLREREAQARASGNEAGDSAAVATICRLVEGMPLALELAASLSRYLTHEQLAEQIARDIDVLRGDLRNVPVRHRSVPGLLDESCRRLTTEQLRVLLGLSVFEGSFTAEAAAAVAGASLPLLGVLVDHSLVQPRQGRFSLHPLMRQFATQKLAEGYFAIQERHAEYYCGFLAERRRAFEGDREIRAVKEVHADFRNIEAAWRWAAAQRRFDLIHQAIGALFIYTQYRSRYLESEELGRVALAALESAPGGNEAALAELLMRQAWALFRLGRYPAAAECAARSGEIYRRYGIAIPPGIGTDPATPEAVVCLGTGDYPRCYEIAAEAAAAARSRGDELGEAFAAWLAGSALFRQAVLVRTLRPGGRKLYRQSPDSPRDFLGEAKAFVSRAAELLERRGQRWFMVMVETELGLLAGASGDEEAELAHFEAACELSREFADAQSIGTALIYIADVLINLGELDRAEECHRESYAHFRDLGDLGVLSEVERSMGRAAIARGDLARACELLASALEKTLAIGFLNNTASVLRGFADLALAGGHRELAFELFSFVGGYPASTPMTRADARAMAAGLAESLPAETVAVLLERVQSEGVEEIAARTRALEEKLA
jgi:predicted ATPase/DNA-binding winged helix-turn-helix (wHTH) protein